MGLRTRLTSAVFDIIILLYTETVLHCDVKPCYWFDEAVMQTKYIIILLSTATVLYSRVQITDSVTS